MSINSDCSVAAQPQHGVVEFVPADFIVLYPEFTGVAPGTLTLYFDLATMIVNNTCGSIVSDAAKRERLLNLLTAHIATLQPVLTAGSGAGSGPSLVGRVASATEGTVSISAQYATQVSQSMAWFIQTQYGALFWQLTSGVRSMRYVAPCNPCGPAGVFAGRRG